MVWLKASVALHNDYVVRTISIQHETKVLCKICRIILQHSSLPMSIKVNIFSALLVSLQSCNICWHAISQNIARVHYKLIYIIHLLERTDTNIIFIWSGKVILGEAKPSPNITLSDQINMILGEVLSNKCFIIPATFCAPGASHALLIQTKRPFTRYQCAPVQVCVLRHLF